VAALESRLAWFAENQEMIGASDSLIAEQVGFNTVPTWIVSANVCHTYDCVSHQGESSA
jgi:hypothetical protein